MPTIESDFGGIALGVLLSSVGLISIVVSLFRLRNKDFSLLNFGLFCFLNGIRWLVEIPTMKMLVGWPFTYPYFHGLLTYALVIPFSAFLVDIFGHGLYASMLWIFRSTIVYTAAAIGMDVFGPGPLTDARINPAVIVLWCVLWIANVLFIKKPPHSEWRILRAVFLTTLLYTAVDNLVNIRALPWGLHFEHGGFLVLCVGLGYVAVHHHFATERKLLAIEQEIEIARRIQRSNLPGDLRSPSGLDIAARYIPMSAVAGDFYDIQVKDQTGVGVLIADVSGHGVGAALIGSMLKVAFASQIEHLSDPGKVLMEINRILQNKMDESFVTACALFLDAEHGTLRYANAGHPPPILLRRAKNEVHRLTEGGTMLGPLPDVSYENTTLRVAKDDRIVLCTDGILETRNQSGTLFGDERLLRFIEAHANEPAARTADQLVDHLVEWSGRSGEPSFDDDLTFIIIDVAFGPSASA